MSHAALKHVGMALYIDMTFASNPPHNFQAMHLKQVLSNSFFPPPDFEQLFLLLLVESEYPKQKLFHTSVKI